MKSFLIGLVGVFAAIAFVIGAFLFTVGLLDGFGDPSRHARVIVSSIGATLVIFAILVCYVLSGKSMTKTMKIIGEGIINLAFWT